MHRHGIKYPDTFGYTRNGLGFGRGDLTQIGRTGNVFEKIDWRNRKRVILWVRFHATRLAAEAFTVQPPRALSR